ncbi:MAG: hypothetical protein J5980_09645 [Muribaculaceae bacterium]|nr:hypothetical protein [Muribaculaceae bacterium]
MNKLNAIGLFVVLAMVSLMTLAQGRIARIKQGIFLYSNWDAPHMTLDTCLDMSITEARIPDTIVHNGRAYPVVEIGPGAFQGCHNLTTVVLPSTMGGILKGAFHDCPRLRVIVCRNPVPNIIEDIHPFYGGKFKDIFEPYHALSTILVVPPGCEEAYRNTKGWREFRVIQSTMPTGDELKVDEIELRINELESQLTRARGEVRRLEAELDALKDAVSPEPSKVAQ